MSDAAVATPVGVHAHRCEVCAANGKQVIWVHSDNGAGDVSLHKCPQCGKIEWKKFLVEPGQLPRVRNANNEIDFNTLLGYVLLAVGIALVCYCSFLYVKKLREKKTELPLAE